MREPDDEVGEGQRGRAKRDILFVGAIIGLARNLAPGKVPEILKNEPS